MSNKHGVLGALKESLSHSRCLSAVQTINHRQWQVDYDPLSVFMRFWVSEHRYSPDMLKVSKWHRRRKGAAVSQEGLQSESRIKYCCFTAQLSRGKLCFIVTDTGQQAPPIWRKYPKGLQVHLWWSQSFDVALKNVQCGSGGFWIGTMLEMDL